MILSFSCVKIAQKKREYGAFMKIKQVLLVAVAILMIAIFVACSSYDDDVQVPADSPSNQEMIEGETAETYDYGLQVASELPLTDARVERLISFFAEFGGWFGVTPALGDYDVNLPDSIYVALDFVLGSRVFTHGREGILGYPHYGYAVEMGGERFFSWEEVPSGVMPSYEFITAEYVDSVLWSLFAITGFEHGVSDYTPTFGFRYYHGGYYYRFLAQGGGDFAVIDIAALYDNGNGTYSVVIEYLWAEPDAYGVPQEPTHTQYNIAVIQPFANTYQLLYWRNNVARETLIPVRQPIS